MLFVKLIQHVFSVYQLNTQHIYWANVVQKFKIVNLDFNLVPRLIQVCREFNGDIRFLRFRLEILF